jgi:hypothetical protein
MGVGGQRHGPAVYPRERDPVQVPGPVWMGAAPGFDPRTVQPAESRHTDYHHFNTNRISVRVILGSRHGANEICTFLGFFAA